MNWRQKGSICFLGMIWMLVLGNPLCEQTYLKDIFGTQEMAACGDLCRYGQDFQTKDTRHCGRAGLRRVSRYISSS